MSRAKYLLDEFAEINPEQEDMDIITNPDILFDDGDGDSIQSADTEDHYKKKFVDPEFQEDPEEEPEEPVEEPPEKPMEGFYEKMGFGAGTTKVTPPKKPLKEHNNKHDSKMEKEAQAKFFNKMGFE